MTRASAGDFAFEYRVRFTDIDWMGRLHHQHYPRLFDWTREEFFRAIGHPFLTYIKRDQWLAVLSVSFRVTGPAGYDDIVCVVPQFTQVTKARIHLAYEVANKQSGNPIATGTSEHVILTGQGKVVRVPPDFLEWVASVLSTDRVGK